MAVTAAFIEHTFLGTLALYVTAECALTIMQTRAAEKSVDRVPEGFENKLSLAAVRKAADYTGELAQANLLLTFVGAIFALIMTYGHGLTVLASLAQALFGEGLAAQWTLIAVTLLFMTLIELPFGWWARFRVKERYGYMREARLAWLTRTVRETFAGWLLLLPFAALALVVFEYAGRRWWVLAWALWTAYLIWRWQITRVEGIYWQRRSRPFKNQAVRESVRAFLAEHGIEMTDMIVMTRPASWDHSNIVLAGWGRKRAVVVFAHAAALLKPDEILAAVAHETGHIRRHHALVRIVMHSAVGLLFCALAGWGARHAVFFEGFGFSPVVSFELPGTRAGYVIALALVTFPILLYPMSPVINFISRLTQYDADRFAAQTVGADAMKRTLVRLHRNFAETLTPSRLYSLFHYRRPHAGMRMANLRRFEEKHAAPAELSEESSAHG